MSLEITKSIKSQRILYTILLLTLLWSSLFAQEISESPKYMSSGKQNSFSLEIENANKDDISQAWIAFVKEKGYGRIRKNKKADEFFGQDLSIRELKRNTPISIYTKSEQKENLVIFTSWVNLGDRYVSTNSTPNEAVAYTGVIEDFYFFSKKLGLEKQLKSEEKQLSKYNKALKKLNKKQTKLEKSIEKNLDKIEKAEGQIEILANDKILQLEKVEQEKSLLQDAYDQGGSEEIIYAQKKALKKSEKEFAKIKKTVRKLQDSITKMTRQNEDNAEHIEKILIDQEGQKQVINKQESLISNLQLDIKRLSI